MLRVYLAGKVVLEDGDLLVPEKRFPGPQGRLAFAALAWERQRAISIHELADIVWDGEPPTAWQTALRALISKVRTALDGVVSIEHAFGCYQLRLPPDAWVDVEACHAAVHEAETALRKGEPERAMGSALVANAIARRPFLEGDVSRWSEVRREHLRQVRVRALEARGRLALLRGDSVGAVTDAQIVLQLDPYRESASAILMQAHVAAGNPAHALAAYERLRARLAEDLGTMPSAETEAVFLTVLAGRDVDSRNVATGGTQPEYGRTQFDQAAP
jgi:DNA-binding SARP family transcriptional activator